jgi:D-hexose-6-phosphate mutarotase
VTEEEPPVETVTLIDEEGGELVFALHDAFDVEDVTYYLVEGVEDPELVLVLREEEGRLVSIDGEEFDRIMALLETENQ